MQDHFRQAARFLASTRLGSRFVAAGHWVTASRRRRAGALFIAAIFLGALLLNILGSPRAKAVTVTFTSSGTWTVPGGVTSATVETWGAGGGGGVASFVGSSGGGGGAYASSTISTSASTYGIDIGASGAAAQNGGYTSFHPSSYSVFYMAAAGGGNSLSGNITTPSTAHSGGFSASTTTGPSSSAGAGGGSSAGTAANGNNGTIPTGGAAPTGGGAGGNGGNANGNRTGSAGSAPGGGGGGGGVSSNGTGNGGAGAAGKVLITYTGGPQTYTTAGSFTFTVPAGVTSVDIECWGGGGGGSASANGLANGWMGPGAGGTGGSYIKTSGLAVQPGESLAVVVGSGGTGGAPPGPPSGSSGGNSSVTATGIPDEVLASGGNTTNPISGSPGAGGAASNSIGTNTFDGGAGGNGVSSNPGGGGGGGSSGGSSAAGNAGVAGSGSTGGAGGTAPTGGYAGGAGGNDSSSGQNAPSVAGGGGGSGQLGSSPVSGAGGSGYVAITYTVSNSAPNAPTLSSPSNGATVTSTTPQFQMSATDPDSDTIKHDILIYNTSANSGGNCTGSLNQEDDQNSSGTGWDNGTTAYTSGATATYTVQAGSALARGSSYCWQAKGKDPVGSNTFGSLATAQTLTVNSAPNAPTLSAPASGATGVSVSPTFTLSGTDPDGDSLQYKIILYQSDCSTVVATADMTTSTTGWDNTSYTSGATANYTYTATLSNSTTYCWKAAAIDPSGSNTFGSYSGTQSFTTLARAGNNTVLQGGINFGGGAHFGN